MTTAYGPHPARVRILGNLAHGYVKLRRFDDTLRAVEAARAAFDSATSPRVTLGVLDSNRGLALFGLGRTAEALDAFRAALATYTAALGPDHTRLAEPNVNLRREAVTRCSR
jgi:hypothetical protein